MIRKLAAGTFHGKKLDSHEIAGFRLSEWTYAPDLRFPKHAHEPAFFNIVIEGAYSEIYGREARTYRPLTLVFHPAGEVHSNHIHEAVTRIFDLEIEPRRLESAREHGRIVDGPAEFSRGPAVWLARRLYNEFHRMDDVSPLAIEGLALELLAEASRRPVTVTERQPHRQNQKSVSPWSCRSTNA